MPRFVHSSRRRVQSFISLTTPRHQARTFLLFSTNKIHHNSNIFQMNTPRFVSDLSSFQRSNYSRCYTTTTTRKTGSSSSRNPKHSKNANDDEDDDNSVVAAFDRQVKLLQRNSAARAHRHWQEHQQQQAIDVNDENRDQLQQQQQDFETNYYDYFRQEFAARLVDRLDDIKREEGFPLALDIGT